MKAQFFPYFNVNLSQPQLNSISTKLRINLTSSSASNQPQPQPQLNHNLNLNSIWLWHKSNTFLFYILNIFFITNEWVSSWSLDHTFSANLPKCQTVYIFSLKFFFTRYDKPTNQVYRVGLKTKLNLNTLGSRVTIRLLLLNS